MKTIYKNIRTICFFSLFTIACGSEKSSEVKTEKVSAENSVQLTEAQFKTAGIQTGKIEQRNMSGVIKVNGMLDVPPQNLITISIPYGGTVKQTDLLQGMKVNKGQVLAILEHPDYVQLQQDYLDTKSKLDFTALELKRQEELQKENVNSTKTYQQASSEYQSLKARVNGLQEKLSMINISTDQLTKNGITKQIKLLAPISGYVTLVNVNVGAYVNPNDVICRIVDTRHLHVELTVFEKDVLSLKTGQKVRFNFNNETADRFATVYLIGKEISPDRTVRVHCHMDKEDENLLPGMFLKAYIETSSKGVAVLPSQAVVQSEGKNYIFVYGGKEKNNVTYDFTKLEVGVGIKDDQYTEIVLPDTFDQNTLIVTQGAYDLLSAMNNKEEE